MSWEPRDENKPRFDELDKAIQTEENNWARKGMNRRTFTPDILRMSQRLDALIDLLTVELIDRDALVLLSMEKELKLLQDVRAEFEEQRVTPNIVNAKTIPKGRPRG